VPAAKMATPKRQTIILMHQSWREAKVVNK
jgi:hypothetical protein